MFLDHTQRSTTVGRTLLDEWSARRRDLYLTTHNTHNRQTFMLRVGFEPTISAGERPQTNALDRASTGSGIRIYILPVTVAALSEEAMTHWRAVAPNIYIYIYYIGSRVSEDIMFRKANFGMIGVDSNLKYFKAVLLAYPIQIYYSNFLSLYYYPKYFSTSWIVKITSISLWAFQKGYFSPSFFTVPYILQVPMQFVYIFHLSRTRFGEDKI